MTRISHSFSWILKLYYNDVFHLLNREYHTSKLFASIVQRWERNNGIEREMKGEETKKTKENKRNKNE
jgi:hypothetical protein